MGSGQGGGEESGRGGRTEPRCLQADALPDGGHRRRTHRPSIHRGGQNENLFIGLQGANARHLHARGVRIGFGRPGPRRWVIFDLHRESARTKFIQAPARPMNRFLSMHSRRPSGYEAMAKESGRDKGAACFTRLALPSRHDPSKRRPRCVLTASPTRPRESPGVTSSASRHGARTATRTVTRSKNRVPSNVRHG